MARSTKTPEQVLAELQAKKRQIDERIKTQSARLNAVERKADTRRKILAGAVALEHAEHDKDFKAKLYALIQRGVTRDNDRALFNLDALPKGAKSDT